MSAIGNKHRQHGYTLVELLVVMAIISLVFAALPFAMRPDGKADARQAAERLAQDARDLALAAQQKGKVTHIEIDNNGNGYRLQPQGTERRLPAGLRLYFKSRLGGQTGRTDALSFYPSGRTNGGMFELVGDHGSLSLTFDGLTGAMRQTP